MKRLLSFLLFIVILSGCNSELFFTKVGKDNVNKDIQSFIDKAKDENGVHLYLDKQKTIYVYLNGKNVKKGEKAVHFTDFDVKKNGKSLNILYSNDETTDYSNQSLNYEILYKVNLDKNYENIKLFSNGVEDSFGLVSGN